MLTPEELGDYGMALITSAAKSDDPLMAAQGAHVILDLMKQTGVEGLTEIITWLASACSAMLLIVEATHIGWGDIVRPLISEEQRADLDAALAELTSDKLLQTIALRVKEGE